MTPAAIIEAAAADGVRLALTEAGTLKTIGRPDSVRRWVPHLKAHRLEIIKLLTPSTMIRSTAWLLHCADRNPLEVWTAPPATHMEVLEPYPEAITAEPIQASQCDNGAEDVGIAPPPRNAPVASCRTCRHLKRPGLSPGYCGERDDLPPAYTAGHPLRRLPADRGATCTTWEIQT